jgi:hypothetical protein
MIVLQHEWRIGRLRICVYKSPQWKISRGTLDLGRLRIRWVSKSWHPIYDRFAGKETGLAICNGGKLWDKCRLVDEWR